MTELVPGGNVPLPGGILTLRVPGPFDVCALITDDGGKVRGDGDFVFYNQPTAPGTRLQGERLTIDPLRLRSGASRVTVVISSADPATPLARLPAPTLQVAGPGPRTLARFTPPRPQRETVLLLAEIYRRGGAWKLRALGQGYADGLAGLARDFGVDVAEDDTSPGGAPHMGRAAVRGNAAPRSPGPTGPANAVPDTDGFLGLVNSARARAGSPPVSLDARLAAAARAHASDMAARGVLSSESPDGTSLYQRVTSTGYAYLTVGEHLVSGPRTPREFVEYCLSAEQSRTTLCERVFSQVGLAHVADRSGDLYWTALWARPFTPADLVKTENKVVALTNAERTAAGLRPLSVDPLLTNAAQAHSSDMVARAFYSHTSPGGSQPWDRAAAAGSRRRTIGENIACGQRSPAEVVLGWMNSPGHRANILKPDFTHIGIGLAGGGKAGTYWTQLFGA
ncbi:CAP domain-containing protein [Streptomyces sp. NBC_00038]|uniref:CAP domain-containing protein n=1 Tax=Streptomyces sp. NBC_00038 TaxID=2903615 RepID=UPI002253DB3E|nr:CAP domain-containing protein [Streptomyces sp. NBC_00038]MCX5563203.1 CAP domain-containing protein [Streptomyces sp. NBC_00038]